jgi:hypothetical protein
MDSRLPCLRAFVIPLRARTFCIVAVLVVRIHQPQKWENITLDLGGAVLKRPKHHTNTQKKEMCQDEIITHSRDLLLPDQLTYAKSQVVLQTGRQGSKDAERRRREQGSNEGE